ncbi:MAG: hypothetical protein IIC41_05120 [Candidatus Marinimicrobia bacterium]|nr:hypothetical protein [Candidatus Neomarinimicrobiota bacterium]
MRRSNTEPVIRIIAEGPTVDDARALVEQVRQALAGNTGAAA